MAAMDIRRVLRACLLAAIAAAVTAPPAGATVDNIAPVPVSAVAGTQFSGAVATFNSVNTSDSFEVTIDWGDGSATSSGSVTPGKTLTVTGAHTYPKAGKYAVMVSVLDVSDKKSGSTTTTATVAPPRKLSATLALAAGSSKHVGGKVRFTATASATPGIRIFDYKWSFDRGRTFTADTGVYPTAVHRYATPGHHTVTLEVQGVDSHGVVSTARTQLTVNSLTGGSQPGCTGDVQLGFLEFLANCITNDHGKYQISLDGGAGFAGLELSSTTSGAKLTLDTTGSNSDGSNPNHDWVLSADSPVTLSIINTSIGSIALDTIDLHANPVHLPFGADAPDQHAPGLRVFTLEARSTCPSHTGVPPVVCATLPGNFPLEGSISVYATGDLSGTGGLGAAVQANVHLRRPIDITGSITLTGDSTGVNVDEMSFGVQGFNVGSLISVDPIALSYTRRDSDTGDMDVWEASGGAAVHVPPSNPNVMVAVRFANGSFQRATVNLGGSIALGPVTITALGGTFGFNPLTIGANIGGTVGPWGVQAGVFYQEATATQPWHLQVGSFFRDPMDDPNHVRQLFVSYANILSIGGVLNLYGDGFVSGGLNATVQLPNLTSDHPTLRVEGHVYGWFQPPTSDIPFASYQVTGGVRAEVNLGPLNGEGEVQGFINNAWARSAGVLVHTNYLAGCGSLTVHLGPFTPTVGGWVRDDLTTGDTEAGLGGCDNIQAYCAAPPPGRSAPPCLGFARDAAAFSSARQRFQIPAGYTYENLKLTSATGFPRVRISGPSGTYTTPAGGAAFGQKPSYLSGAIAGQHQLDIGIIAPKPGVYSITPLPGTPAISPVLESHPLPNPDVHVRVTGSGRTRTLHYSLRAARGQRVVFVEHAADVATVIGSTTKASGSITFLPQPGNARRRTIEADFYEGGIPQKPRVVGRYTAPAARPPGPPKRLRVTRRANVATVTWTSVPGATGYVVWVTGSDGRHVMYALSRRARRLRIAPVFGDVTLTVSVSATGGPSDLAGPARKARLGRARGR